MEPKKSITLAEFKQATEFLMLTEQQKRFVLKYFENRDADAAAAYAYPNIRDKHSQRNRLLSDAHILAAIDLWYGTEIRDATIASVRRELRRSRSAIARAQLLKLLSQLQGLVPLTMFNRFRKPPARC